jgi:hypothetical protein
VRTHKLEIAFVLFIIVIVMTAAIAWVELKVSASSGVLTLPLVTHIGADIAIEVDAGALMA